MDVTELVRDWRTRSDGPAEVVAHHLQPPREARTDAYPEWVHPDLRAALEGRGVLSLYSHQRLAADHLHAGKHTVVATPTASGKSLCYHLPVLDALMRDGADARALYLFPTKALSRDQMGELERILAAVERNDLHVAVYDGDTPPSTRRTLREGGHLVLTNPHMLHTGILPNHTKWQGLFSSLRYVVIDEVHTLSGVYGSHVANVLRRLRRICAHYGSEPTFCAASATISNPGEHAQRLLELPAEVVDQDGSAHGPKHFFFLNPRLFSEVSGLRTPAVEAARQVAGELLSSDVQTITFARSRNTVEVLVKYLRDEAKQRNVDERRVAGYRGGYLPELRRDIERGIGSGEITSVVATSALELGIDIGSLDVCLLVGYPGTVSSTFQRAGRVGRRNRESAVLFLARAFPIDQYIVHDPGYLFDQPREAVSIDPDNAIVLAQHVKCAAFELPVDAEAGFGQAEHLRDVLDFLADDARVLVREGDRFHFAGATYPADGVSLSTVDADNVVIMDRDHGTVLGEVDRASAQTEVHDGAIYGHQGDQYQVEQLDFEGRRAYVRKVESDYYTQAEVETEIRVLHRDEVIPFATYEAHLGEVHVATLAKAFKKVRFYTRENVGIGDINLPPEEFETEACILAVDPEFAEEVGLGPAGQGGGLRGIAELIQGLVPLFVRVDPGDVRVSAEVRHPHFERPTITVYDCMPGGVGLSERIYRRHRDVLAAARGLVQRCVCRRGCPACVGPGRDQGGKGKSNAVAILEGLLR